MPRPNAGAQTLYALDYSIPPGAVARYSLAGKPLQRVFVGVYDPTSMAVDRNGTLSVANVYGGFPGTITQYANGSPKPTSTITYGIGVGVYELFIDVDPQGNLVALSDPIRYYAPALAEYAPNTVKPSHATVQGLCGTSRVLATRGTFYVSNQCEAGVTGGTGAVVGYSSATGAVQRIITDKISYPGLMAMDSTGALFVVNSASYSSQNITKYQAGKSNAILTVSIEQAGDTCGNVESKPVFDSKDAMYVSVQRCSPGNGGTVSHYEILKFAKGASTPSTTIISSTTFSFGWLALDAQDNVYAVTYPRTSPGSSIVRFAKGSSKHVTLVKNGSFGQILIR